MTAATAPTTSRPSAAASVPGLSPAPEAAPEASVALQGEDAPVPAPQSDAAPTSVARPRGWRRLVPSGRSLVIGVPFGFLLLFFMLPFAVVVKISLASSRLGVPPYADLAHLDGHQLAIRLDLSSYVSVLTDSFYFSAYVNSLRVAFITTLICLAIGYPTAWLIARARADRRSLLMMGVIIPFWTSYLVRVYAWVGLLKDQGLVNRFLHWSGLSHDTVHLMQNSFGLYVGMVYSYLPYMILPLYAFLVAMDRRLGEAAGDLGARPWEAFATVTLPLSMPAVVAGSLLVFIPSVGEYVIPELLGAPDELMIGRVMWSDFFNSIAWPLAAAATCVMVAVLLLPMVWFQRIQGQNKGVALA
jgi:putrescine transport system permease protein